MEADEKSSQSQVISYQQEKPNKEWIYKSIQEGSIHCYPKGDIDVRLLPIAGGAYGAVHEAKMKHNRLIVAIKTLYRNVHDCEEKFYRKLAKEVGVYDFLFNIRACTAFVITNLCCNAIS